MATPNIIVVDSDEGFGYMLKEGLENSGYYHAKCVHTGRKSLELIVENAPNLVIIDVALTDMSPVTLVKAIRETKPEVKIMLIPLMGQDLSDKLKALSVNGILTKPFFVGDLPDLVNKALGVSVTSPVPVQQTTTPPPPTPSATPTAPSSPTPKTVKPATTDNSRSYTGTQMIVTVIPQETISFLRSNESEILRLLDDLNREVRAEAILLIAGQELIAQAGMLGREQCGELTLLVAQSSLAAAHAAKFLGEYAGRFTQSLHEGKEYRLYTLTLGEGILLSLALSSNVPLGMIRHQCRQIADQLSRFII